MGQGIALGWRPLIDPFLSDGQLIALPGLSAHTKRGYFLVEPPRKVRPPACERISARGSSTRPREPREAAA